MKYYPTPINAEPYYIQPGILKIVGIAGKAGSGKGTFGATGLNYGFQEFGFADILKDITTKIFDIPRIHMDNAAMKTKYIPYWGKTIREILQQLGTDAVQPIFGRDIWCRALHQKLHHELLMFGVEKIVITDMRFPWEVEYLAQEMNAYIVRVTRDTSEAGLTESEKKHASEISLQSDEIFKELVPPERLAAITNCNTLEEYKELCNVFFQNVKF